MPFIGNQPAESYSAFQKQDFTTSATTSYTLDHPVSNQNEIALFINFVRQEPTTAYTASGTSLTLTSATSSSDDMYCVYLGKAVQTVNPPSGSVGSSQVAASIITGQTALGATPADTDELLISDAGTLKRVDYSYLKSANTPAFHAYLSSDQTLNNNTVTKVAFDSETFDTDNCYDATTNYRFTPTVAGKYQFNISITLKNFNGVYYMQADIRKNGSNQTSSRGPVFENASTSDQSFETMTLVQSVIMDMNGSSDYADVTTYFYNNGNGNIENRRTFFSGYKIIE